MTDHYRLTVVELSPPRVAVQFRCVHPDKGLPSAERNVAAQVLIEAWWVQGKPEHPRGDLLQQLQDMAEGGDVDGKTPPDLVRFVVKSRRLFERVTYEPSGESPPTGILRMVVRDSRVLSHLTEGMEWSSVVYDVLPYLGER